jgi:hypothetical protein
MFALIIKDEYRHTVLEHVANYEDDSVYIPNADGLDMPSEWRKAGHLIRWVKENRPGWKVYTQNFEIAVSADGNSIEAAGFA